MTIATAVVGSNFERYTDYHESGVDWLGQIPSHWHIRPLFSVAREIDDKNKDLLEQNLLSLSYGRIVPKDITSLDGLLPESFDTYQIVAPDDIILRLTDLQNDQRSLRVGLARERGIITSAYLHLRPSSDLDATFIFAYLHAADIMKVFYGYGGGVRQSMKFADIRRFPVAIPPPDEQKAIAEFLGHETERIDGLVDKKRRLIELLKEKRAALISHTVTKGLPPEEARRVGLDPNPAMKDSGIPWLGLMPAHWRPKQLRRVCTLITDGAHISPDTSEPDKPFISTVDVQNGRINLEDCLRTSEASYRYMVQTGCRPIAGDVLFSKDGSIGKTAIVPNGDFVVASSLVIIRPNPDDLLTPYLNYCLNHTGLLDEALALLAGAALRRISIEKVSRFFLAVPQPPEQRSIVGYLNVETAKIDALLAKQEKVITRLQEYRAALISAAVTGKIDVRNHAGTLNP